MTEHILVGIVSVIVLGTGAQFLASRIRVPAILLLLVVGFLAGPVTHFLEPSSLQGDWVFAFVSISIGIILFEGGLSLKISELREVGKSVFRLITVGVLITWFLAGLSAYYIAGFSPLLSVLLGAILTVTGPTVVIPLLRYVRPNGRVGTIAKWEGITIDPVGAILAVLVLEVILVISGSAAESLSHAISEAFLALFKELVVGIGVSVTFSALMVVMLRRHLIPDYLLNAYALSVVCCAFLLSNIIQEESGLLTTTLMGILMANQRYVSVQRIIKFKEDLQVLLISTLFILLSARLELSVLQYFDTRAFVFLAVVIIVIRPVAVYISTLGTRLTGSEKAFLAWLAPRGIVAAAVASLFAFRLESVFPDEVGRLVPVVFLIIVGTVTVYGLTLSPLARYLKLAQPSPQGVLFLGAHNWGLEVASALHSLGFKVLVVDTNADNILRAKRRDLPAERGNALLESFTDELELGGIGRLIAWTPNDEVNSLGALHFAEMFESSEVYQLAAEESKGQDHEALLPVHLRGRPLFGDGISYKGLTALYNDGARVKVTTLTEDKKYTDIIRPTSDFGAIPLFLVKGKDQLIVYANGNAFAPESGDKLIYFSPLVEDALKPEEPESYRALIRDAHFIDLKEPQNFEQLVDLVGKKMAADFDIPAALISRGFISGAQHGIIPVSQGVAMPHLRVPNKEEAGLVIIRCTEGLVVDAARFYIEVDKEKEEPSFARVFAFLFLISPEDNPGLHLRTLACLAWCFDQPGFIDHWKEAEDDGAIKQLLLVD